MSTDTIQGNTLIANFMGIETVYYSGETGMINTGKKIVWIGDWAKYHTSWNWQIPAWSKIAKLVKKIADNGGESEYAIYMGLIGRYENAVFNNVPLEGFVVITDAIFWYNQTTKTQQ